MHDKGLALSRLTAEIPHGCTAGKYMLSCYYAHAFFYKRLIDVWKEL